MIDGKKLVVVLPAYNAERTLELTFNDIPRGMVDEVILVDDRSKDDTVVVAEKLGIAHIHVHQENQGYGGNQKTCYRAALGRGRGHRRDAAPRLPVRAEADHRHGGDDRLGRLRRGARLAHPRRRLHRRRWPGGMPLWKYVANRALTALPEPAHAAPSSRSTTAATARSRARRCWHCPLLANSDDFVFDNQMLVQAIARAIPIGEISCPTRYRDDSSSINFTRSVRYGFGVLGTSFAYRAWRWGLARPAFLDFQSDRFLRAAREEDPVAG